MKSRRLINLQLSIAYQLKFLNLLKIMSRHCLNSFLNVTFTNVFKLAKVFRVIEAESRVLCTHIDQSPYYQA